MCNLRIEPTDHKKTGHCYLFSFAASELHFGMPAILIVQHFIKIVVINYGDLTFGIIFIKV